MLVEHDGKSVEMHAEMAKIARTIKIRDKLRAIHANRTCLSDYYQADTALDPALEWLPIADYDIELQ